MSGLGIGASGLLGVALEVLSPPVQAATTPSASGGTLATGTYRYYVTAINALGETNVSNEQSAVVTGPTGSVTVNWAAVTGATGYRIYRTAVGGASGTELFLAAVGVTTSYLDDGSLTPSGAYPTANTAYDAGVYHAPTKFIPITSESLHQVEETIFRRPIRESASVIGAVAGNEHAEGEVAMEALEDCLLYFILAARATTVKTGSSPNFIYTTTPNANAVPTRTLSVTIVRAGEVFAYTGVTVGSFKFGIEDGLLTFGINVIARQEATQSAPTTTWPTTAPFGAGMYSIEIPTATPVTDTDTFEWTCEDNAEVQFRLKSTSRGADFVKFGERDVTMTAMRDFLSKTDYNAFKAVTSQSITLTATKGANNNISILTPVAIKETYEVGLDGQGDLIRANISYRGMIDGAGKDYQLVIKTQEDIAV